MTIISEFGSNAWPDDPDRVILGLPRPTAALGSAAKTSKRSPLRTIVLGVGGRGGLMLVNMAVLVVTSRILTPVQFGTFAIAQLCVDLASTISHSLVGVSMLRRKRLRGIDYANAFTLLLAIGCAGGLLLALAAGLIETWLRMPGLAPLLRMTGAIVPLRFLASFFIATLQRQLRVETIIWAQTRSQILAALGVTLTFAVLGFGAWSLVFGLLASTSLELFWCARASRARPRLALGVEARRILADGVAPLSNRLLIFGADSLDRIAIGAVFGAASLGIYARASNIVLLPSNLIGIPAQSALLSWFSRIQGQTERVRHAIHSLVSFQSLLIIPITAGFCLGASLLVQILLGRQWNGAVPLAQFLFIGTFARLGATPLESAALTLGYAWGSARRQFLSAAVLVVGLAIGLFHSLLWIAVAVAASRIAYYLLSLRFAVITFRVSRTDVFVAHLKGLAITLIGLAVAVPILLLVPDRVGLLREAGAVAAYGLAVMLILLAGPSSLVDSVGRGLVSTWVIVLRQRLFRR